MEKPAGLLCHNPILVCGSHRAGTTALFRALMAHPDLAYEGFNEKEHPYFEYLFRARDSSPLRDFELDRRFVRESVVFASNFLARSRAGKSSRYVTANPNNLWYISDILSAIPDAKFVLMIRHPQETIWSKLHNGAAASAGWRRSDANKNDPVTDEEIASNAEDWKKRARLVLSALRGDFGSSVLVLKHEALEGDPRRTADQLLTFLEVPADPAVGDLLATQIHGSSFRSDDAHVDASRRNAHFQQKRSDLAREKEFCRRICESTRPEMDELGYSDYAEQAPSPQTDEARPEKRSRSSGPKNATVRIAAVSLEDGQGHRCCEYRQGDQLVLRVQIEARGNAENLSVSFAVFAEGGKAVGGTTTFDERLVLPHLINGETHEVTFAFPEHYRSGRYDISVAVNSVTRRDYSDNVLWEQRDKAASFTAVHSEARPIHYLVHVPCAISQKRLSERPAQTHLRSDGDGLAKDEAPRDPASGSV